MSHGTSELVLEDQAARATHSQPVTPMEGCPAPVSPLLSRGSSRLSVELFDPRKHYDTICGWWESQNPGSSVPITHLSSTGVVACRDGEPSAAVWIYKSDSAFCWIAFPVASPKVRKHERAAVLDVLVSSAKMLAKTMGFQSAVMSLRSQCLEKRIQEHGFKPTDRGVTHYLGDLRS